MYSADFTVHFSREIFRWKPYIKIKRKFHIFRATFYLKQKCKQRFTNCLLFFLHRFNIFNIFSAFWLVWVFDFASKINLFFISLAKFSFRNTLLLCMLCNISRDIFHHFDWKRNVESALNNENWIQLFWPVYDVIKNFNWNIFWTGRATRMGNRGKEYYS